MSSVIKTWYDLIRIPSINGNERSIAEYIAHYLETLGLEVHWSYFDADKEHMRPSLWTRLEGTASGPTIMLAGHIDTVDVAEGWLTDPFEPVVDAHDDTKVYGLGAMDMKGGLAAILETLTYYATRRDELQGDLLACFVSDEEVLSQGTYQLASEGLTADFAIMAECRFHSMAIGFRGRYSFDVKVSGEGAHSSLYPKEGQNALLLASQLVCAIEEMPTLEDPDLGAGTWVVRYIEGGNQRTLIVPDECYISIDRFVVPGETIESCLKQIYIAAQELGIEDNVQAKLRARDNPYMEPFKLSKDHPLVQAMQEAYSAVTGNPLSLAYDLSVCDSNILAVQMNIPTVTLGPSGGNMHQANEYGWRTQVEQASKIYRQAISQLLSQV